MFNNMILIWPAYTIPNDDFCIQSVLRLSPLISVWWPHNFSDDSSGLKSCFFLNFFFLLFKCLSFLYRCCQMTCPFRIPWFLVFIVCTPISDLFNLCIFYFFPPCKHFITPFQMFEVMSNRSLSWFDVGKNNILSDSWVDPSIWSDWI